MNDRQRDRALREFTAEADELIEDLYANLAQAQEAVASGKSVRPELLNAVFRAAHTLKGMGGMVGLQPLSEFAHLVEEMLDRVRMGKLSLDRPLLETLSASVDLFHRLAETVTSGGGVDLAAASEKIGRILSASRIPTPASSPPLPGGEPAPPGRDPGDPLAKIGLPARVLDVLTEYETHRLRENLLNGSRLYELTAAFPLASFDSEIRAVNAKIGELGEIISTLPGAQAGGGDTGRIVFQFLVALPPGAPAIDGLIPEGLSARLLGDSGAPSRRSRSEAAASRRGSASPARRRTP